MSLTVAELVATLKVDTSTLVPTLKTELEAIRRALADGFTTGAQEAASGLEANAQKGARSSVETVKRTLDAARPDVGLSGRRLGEAFAGELEREARDVDGVDPKQLGDAYDFREAGHRFGDALGDAVESEVDKIDAVDPDQLGTRRDFAVHGGQLGDAFADGVESEAKKISTRVTPDDLGSRSQFGEHGEDLGEALTDGLGDGVDGNSGVASDAMGGLLGSLPAALTSPASAAGAAVGALLIAGMQDAMEAETVRKKTAAALALPASEAGGLDKEIDEVRRAGGWDRDVAAEAVVGIRSTFDPSELREGFADAEIQAIAFSQTFNEDMTLAIGNAGLLVKNGLAKDATEAFDLMTQAWGKAKQASRDELGDAVEEYTQFGRGLGLTGEQMFEILTRAADGGRYVVDKTGDSLKEFGATNRNMTAAMRLMYARIGLDADDMQAKIAAGGPEAREALGQIADGLLGIEDPLGRSNAAIALFGDTLTDIAGNADQLDTFLQSLSGEGMADFEGASQRNVDAAKSMSSEIQASMDHTKEVIGESMEGAYMIVASIWDSNMRDKTLEGWSTVWAILKDEAGSGLDTVKSALETGAGEIVDEIKSLPGQIGEAASGMWDGVVDSFRGALGRVVKGWNDLKFPAFHIPEINIPGVGKIGGGEIGGWDLPNIPMPKFHTGGIIPGPPGKETPILAQAGEQVIPIDQVNKSNSALPTSDLPVFHDSAVATLGPEVMATVAAGRLPAAVMQSAAIDTGGTSVPPVDLSRLDRMSDEIRTLARAVATRGDTISVTEAVDGRKTATEIFREKRANAHAVVG